MALQTAEELKSNGLYPTQENPIHFHAGDLGDIINYLPTMLTVGGTLVLVNQDQGQREFLGRSGMQSIQSLLTSVAERKFTVVADYNNDIFHSYWPGAFAFNPPHFHSIGQLRSGYFSRQHAGKLTLMQSFLAQVTGNYPAAVESPFHRECSWVDPDNAERPRDLIVFSRTSRYHSLLTKSLEFYRYAFGFFASFNCVFIGTREEYADFSSIFGAAKPKFYPTETAYDVRAVLSRARVFIGNQSFNYALAEAMKVPAILERCPTADSTAFQRHRLFHVTDEGIVHSSGAYPSAPIGMESVYAAITKVAYHQDA